MNDRDKTYERLVKTLDMSHTQANFVIAFSKWLHLEEQEALEGINNFLDKLGL